MNANELRIGNYVFINKKISKMHNISAEITRDYSKIEPIPLTEEWLQKFGFTHTKYGGTYLYECFELSIESEYNQASIVGHKTKDEPLKCYLEDVDSQKIGNEIQYVHTLQNLIFALTGNELQIK